MSLRFAVLLGIAFFFAAASSAGTQPLTQRDIGVHLALDMVHAAIAECDAKGLSVSVVVLDRVGRIRAMAMADRGGGHTVELARRKAYTALALRKPSRDWIAAVGPDSPDFGERSVTEVLTIPGGFPVKIGEETIGAVGVAGSTIETDEACARTAATLLDRTR